VRIDEGGADIVRIALVGTRGVPAHYGGFETCVEEVGQRLAARGHDVVVYCRRQDDVPQVSEYMGMQLVWRGALHRKCLETLSNTALATAHLMRHRPDVAIVFNAANAPFLPLLRARGIPVITHVDGLEWKRSKWRGAGRRYYRMAESMAVRWSDALIADAPGIANYYRSEFDADTVQIAYGAPLITEPSSELIEDLDLHPGKYHLIVARFEPENHVDLLVEGYSRSKAELPLVVVGGAPYADEYTQRVHALADGRVRFLGSVWDQKVLDELYANALTYLHGHSVGGTNPSLLRAMGAATSVIAYDVEFNRDVLGSPGIFVTTPEDVSRAVEAAEQEPGVTAIRGIEAQHVARRFDWDDVADSYAALCSELVSAAARKTVAKRPSGRRRVEVAPTPARPRRVLVAHPSTERYGADRQMLESVAALRDAGYEVSVCVPQSGPLLEDLVDIPVDVAPFPVLRKALLRPAGLVRLLAATPRDLSRIRAQIKTAEPDLVYVNTLTIPLWILAARLVRRPVLVHVHEAEQEIPPPLRMALAAPLLLAHRVITNSEAARRTLVDAVPRLADRTDVVANGVPDHGPVAGPLVERHRARLVLVGRLAPRKGSDVALEATAILRGEGRDVQLQLCGDTFAGYEWYEQQLRERAAEPDLADGAVRFDGFVSDPHGALAGADVVLVPSRAEPFGNAAVEAMLAQRPVVVSDVQGLTEIVTDGHTGLLVPPDDPDALADAIRRVLDDPVLARRLAASGRIEARVRFGCERYRRDVCQAVDEVARS
jgi:glycosyltransferase involved in cell wall biosynthesis